MALDLNNLNDQDKAFLKSLKDKGVGMEDAFARLEAVKPKESASLGVRPLDLAPATIGDNVKSKEIAPEASAVSPEDVGAAAQEAIGLPGVKESKGLLGKLGGPKKGEAVVTGRKGLKSLESVSEGAAEAVREGKQERLKEQAVSAIPGGAVAESTLKQAGEGLKTVGTGIKEQAVESFVEPLRKPTGVPEEATSGEGFTKIIQGGLQTLFSPVAGVLQEVPGGEKLADLASLPSKAVANIYEFAAKEAGVDVETEAFQQAKEQIITAFDVGTVAFAPAAIKGVKKVVGKAGPAKAAASGALKASAEADVAKILSPTKDATKIATQKILPETTAKIKPTVSRQKFLERTQRDLDVVREKFDAFEAEGGVQGSTKRAALTDFLKTQKKKFTVEGAVVEPRAIKAIEAVEEVVNAFPETIPNTSLRTIRQMWDRTVAESNGFTRTLKEGAEVNIKKDLTNFMREKLAETNPELAKINKEFSALKNLETVLVEATKRKTGQTGIVTKGVGATVGSIVGSVLGGPGTAVLGAGAGAKMASLMSSTAWRSVSAAAKSKLAKALAEGDGKAATSQITSLHKKAVQGGLISVPAATTN